VRHDLPPSGRVEPSADHFAPLRLTVVPCQLPAMTHPERLSARGELLAYVSVGRGRLAQVLGIVCVVLGRGIQHAFPPLVKHCDEGRHVIHDQLGRRQDGASRVVYEVCQNIVPALIMRRRRARKRGVVAGDLSDDARWLHQIGGDDLDAWVFHLLASLVWLQSLVVVCVVLC
jgi:hypothetical protein